MAQDAELRICRLGAEFRHYERLPGAGPGEWQPATPPSGCAGNAVAGDVLTRSDLPETLQVGMALNFSRPSHLDVAFHAIELVVLARAATAADCTSD